MNNDLKAVQEGEEVESEFDDMDEEEFETFLADAVREYAEENDAPRTRTRTFGEAGVLTSNKGPRGPHRRRGVPGHHREEPLMKTAVILGPNVKPHDDPTRVIGRRTPTTATSTRICSATTTVPVSVAEPPRPGSAGPGSTRAASVPWPVTSAASRPGGRSSWSVGFPWRSGW